MIRGEWVLCCERVIIDAQTNNATLVNVLEQLNLPERNDDADVALVPLAFTIIATWSGEEGRAGESQYRLRFVDGAGQEIFAENHIVRFAPGFHRMRSQVVMFGFPVRASGQYTIESQLPGETDPNEWVTQASCHIDINIAEAREFARGIAQGAM
jgi:hypothetical protein